MTKLEFQEFYDCVIKELGERMVRQHTEFLFCDNPSSLYEEYLNQKTLLRSLYGKESEEENKQLLDRHKVCSCMTVAIIKVRLLSAKIETDSGYELSSAARINEQLAFMSVWELFLGFIRSRNEKEGQDYTLPDTYHNESFLDTFTRSLFLANQLNTLSTPLIANVFFLLEKYCEMEHKKNLLEIELSNSRKE